MMWLTFIATVIVAIPMVSQAWQHSPHTAGAVTDADFWYLIQNCSMTVLALVTMAIPLSKGNNLPRYLGYWIWGPVTIAILCAMTAPVVYLYKPTEWGAFMSIAAGAMQAFVTLQIALVADAAGQQRVKGE
jgi:hypothetical protein